MNYYVPWPSYIDDLLEKGLGQDSSSRVLWVAIIRSVSIGDTPSAFRKNELQHNELRLIRDHSDQVVEIRNPVVLLFRFPKIHNSTS